MATKPTVFVGMSGGVDSSVAAALLKKQGYHVVGAYMKNWSQDLPGMKCPWAEDLADAKRVAVRLGIDFLVFDFQAEYKKKVVDYMLAEFKKGRTPNPDIMCNQEIKFKLFYDVAREHGADLIATGHYAMVGDAKSIPSKDMRDNGSVLSEEPRNDGRDEAVRDGMLKHPMLCRAVDENKDQTYFLYRISPAALSYTLFPIGHLTKPEVKKLAEKYGLPNAHKKESMGVCFVGEVDIRDFLKEYIDIKPGEVRDAETDALLGHHEGAYFYTIGQRHGLYLGGGLPYYVVKKNIKNNIVYVSKNLNSPSLWTTELELEDIVWREGQDGQPSFEGHPERGSARLSAARPWRRAEPTRPEKERLTSLPVYVRLRHRAPLIPAELSGTKLTFKEPIKRVASGQSVVFYGGEGPQEAKTAADARICLGGGIVK